MFSNSLKQNKMSKRTEAPLLPEHLIKNCKLLAHRNHLLKHLPLNGKGIEIGVLGGDWSEHLLRVTQPEELILVDTYNSNDYAHQKRFTKKDHEQYIRNKFTIVQDKVKVVKGCSWEVLATFPENYFDWIYIDAAHDYASVKKDIEQAFHTLKPNGFIIMNDYIMYDHFTKEDYGVVQATNEFMIENNFEMLYFTLHPNLFCDVVIKRIES
jgi:hypothetical protein